MSNELCFKRTNAILWPDGGCWLPFLRQIPGVAGARPAACIWSQPPYRAMSVQSPGASLAAAAASGNECSDLFFQIVTPVLTPFACRTRLYKFLLLFGCFCFRPDNKNVTTKA